MNKTCIVVANAGAARFFGVEPVESPRDKLELLERGSLTNPDLRALGKSVTGRVRTETNTNRGAGPVHPIGAQRERHRGELERRFGQEISRRAASITKGWKDGTVVLVAEPHLLGLMRAMMRKALRREISLKELARDYTHFTPAQLREQLALCGIIPPRLVGAPTV